MLEQRLTEWRRTLILRDAAEGAVRAAAALAGALAALALLDRLLLLPFPVRLTAVAGLAAFLGACVWRFLLVPLRRWTPARVFEAADLLSPGLKRVFLPAWELGRGLPPHVSAELAAAHRVRAEALAEDMEPLDFRLVPEPRLLRRAAAALGALALVAVLTDQPARWERLLTPWRRVPLESMIDFTGDKRVPWGSAVTLNARWRRGGSETLKLLVRAPDGPWREEIWNAEGGGMQWAVASLTEEVQYQLRWRDQATAPHALIPVPFPQFSEVRYRLTPPAGGPAEDLPGGGDVEALAGTTLEVSGKTQDPVERAVLVRTGVPAAAFARDADGGFRASFLVKSAGSFRWELSGPGGISDPQPAEHRITVIEDKAPAIELLSPTFELEIGPQEELPVAFSASDDFGLRSVELVYRARLGGIDSGEQTRRVPGLRAGEKEWAGEYRWPLNAFIPGSAVDFYLLATDNAKPAHTARTAMNVLHVVDFDSTHKDAMGKRESVEKGLERLEKRGRELAGEMRKDARDAALDKDQRAQDAALAKEWSKELDAQAEALDAQDKDPYLNPAVPPADRAVLEDLKRSAKSLLDQSKEAAAKGDFKKAAEAHEQLAEEAKRAAENMKEIGAYQDVRDMDDSSQKMARAGDSMEQALKDLQAKGKTDDQDWKELDKQMKELQRQMSEFAKSMQKFAQKSPKRMTGQEKVYKLPVMEAMKAQDALQQALARHDIAGAAKAAQELSKRLSEMRKMMEEAAGGVQPPQESRASKKLEDLLSEWDKTETAQETAVAGVRPLEDERTQGLLEAQKALLAELARRQRAVLAREKELRLPFTAEIKGAMQRAAIEFETPKIERAPDLLEEAIGRLRLLAPTRPEDTALLESFRQEEEAILAKLRHGADSPAPPADRREKIAKEKASEAAVRGRIEGLSKKLSDLRKDAVFLPREVGQKVDAAAEEAAAAVKSLEADDTRGGLEHEQKALELLHQGKDQANQSMEQEQKMESVLSMPSPGGSPRMRRTGGGAPSQTGTNLAPVKLPASGDYQPPQEIRRQIMESLQEKMPPGKAPEIKQYLKKVAE